MMKRIASILLAAVVMLCAVIPLAVLPAGAEESEIVTNVRYVDENGRTQTAASATKLTAGGNYPAGWYILDGSSVTLGGITFTGSEDNKNVHLIIADGADVTVSGGIILANANTSLTIYAQPVDKGTGKLTVKDAPTYAAGIGSKQSSSCGNITINGGMITANGGYDGAGIGCGDKSNFGTITINGGTVFATSGSNAAGIGGGTEAGDCTGNIVIKGGVVTANSNGSGAGIGSGYRCSKCGNITISGGVVTAIGHGSGAGIGSGFDYSNCGNIMISGGVVTANSGRSAAGIGCGYDSNCGTITISGGVVKATSGDNGAGIGTGFSDSRCGTITISGGYVMAIGNDDGAGIGCGFNGVCPGISISNAVVMATGGESSEAIGNGFSSECGKVSVSSGDYNPGEKDHCRCINCDYFPGVPEKKYLPYFQEHTKKATGSYYSDMPFTAETKIGDKKALEAWLAANAVCGDNHTPGEWEITPATCGTAGEKVKKCTVCGKVLEREEIAPTGVHNEGDWEITPATCGKAGAKVKKCKDCGAELARETIDPTGEHIAGDWVVTVQPCVDAGEKVKTCTVCGAVLATETIAATGSHPFDESTWYYDETTHWHAPTCKHVKEKKDEADHKCSWLTGKCSCGYKKKGATKLPEGYTDTDGTGSVLSGGSVWIIVGVAVALIAVACAAVVVVKKKKTVAAGNQSKNE